MYILATKLSGLPIISLQASDTVAWARRPIIDIANLEIIAFHCQTPNHRSLVLVARDIRQLAPDCIIIDNEDELAETDDIVRLRDLIKTAYTPINKTVISDTGRKLGVVEDYTINLETCRIQKLHIRQSILQAWLGSSLIVDRTQIIDLTPQSITVRDTTIELPAVQPSTVPKSQA